MGKFSCEVLVLVVLLFVETAKFCWCRELDSYGCIEGERQALLKFKQTLKDLSNRLLSWRGEDCCKWQGVGCNNITGHVIKLHLRNPVSDPYSAIFVSNQLKADEINSCLLELKYLTHLDLSCNNFKGSPIPKFIGSLELLRYLNLSTANFSGMIPHHLGNLSHLRVLDLNHQYHFDFRQLNVDNLQWVSRLSSLQRLDMSYVNISKAGDWMQVLYSLPSLLELRLSGCELENSLFHASVNSTTSLSTLEYLDLSSNLLSGLIPDALQNMTSLRVLDLSWNSFNSTIPLWLTNNTSLVHLHLSDNRFNHIEGGISMTLWHLCSFKKLDLSRNGLLQGEMLEPSKNVSQCVRYDLETLSLRTNRFSGRLPHWLGQLKNLKHLDLSLNSFYGQIPASLGRLSALRELHLSDNQLNGTLPDCLGQLSDLKGLDVSSNSLGGIVSEVHFANLSRLESLDISWNPLVFKVRSDWVPLFQLQDIYIASCKIIGSQFPRWLRTQTKIDALDLSNTSISGSLPFWLLDLPVAILYLSNNQLSGPMRDLPPNAIAVDLSNNFISGSLPQNLTSNVVEMNLSKNLISGFLPQNIGDMMPKLKRLFLHGNLLNGSIPTSLCKIKTLQTLDLSKNRLGGNLPHCWRALPKLVVIDLSSNKLSGNIPSSIEHLSRLKSLHLNNNSLDLGENGFFGNLPMWIGESMPRLEILRLRSNMFYGSIPLQLCLLSENFEFWI